MKHCCCYIIAGTTNFMHAQSVDCYVFHVPTTFFIGGVTLNLDNIPRPAKTSVQCKIETMENESRYSIFNKHLIKGWWPLILDTEESEAELTGKVEVELQLLTAQQAEEDPVGQGRKEPNPLPFPK